MHMHNAYVQASKVWLYPPEYYELTLSGYYEFIGPRAVSISTQMSSTYTTEYNQGYRLPELALLLISDSVYLYL
jgi:hypothetical protein